MKRWKKWLIISLLVIAGVTIALSFHQPPMRLMPTPQAFLLEMPNAFAANPKLSKSNRIEFFYATNRLPVGPRINRLYAVVPGRDLHLGVGSILIGTEETTWDKIYQLSTGQSDDRRPQLRLEALLEMASVDETLSARADLASTPPGMRAWFQLLETTLENSPDKDVIIYVHGANSTVERAAGQAAQLAHFTGQNSIVILFAWPTAENFLRYSQDVETAFGAAPQLARLIALLEQHSSARKIDVLSYSAGGTVASSGLALVGTAARQDGATASRLGQVHHAAPDADTRGFVDDLRDYAGVADRVTVSGNMGDSALRLSQTINRGSRAGRPDFRELSPQAARFLGESIERGQVELLSVRGQEDIPGLSARSHGFWYMDPWVSTDVLLGLLFQMPAADRGLVPDTVVMQEGEAPATFWRFPRDYEQRLPAIIASVARKVREAAAPVEDMRNVAE